MNTPSKLEYHLTLREDHWQNPSHPINGFFLFQPGGDHVQFRNVNHVHIYLNGYASGIRSITGYYPPIKLTYEDDVLEKFGTPYHAVMIDETGCEFGASVKAFTKADALLELQETYPESRVDQIESPEDTAERERRMYQSIQEELDGPHEPDD